MHTMAGASPCQIEARRSQMRRYPGVRPVAWGVLALCIGAGRLLTGCSGGDNGGGGNGGGGGNCASGKPGASAPHYKVVDLGPLGAQGGVTCSRPAGPQGLTANEIVGGVDLGGACAEEEAVFWVLNTSVSAIAPQPLPGGQSGESDADAISSDGHIVGQVPQSAGLTNAV